MIVSVNNARPTPPTATLQVLARLGLDYQLGQNLSNLPAATQVQAVLCEDNLGQLLVLLPRDHLLDLRQLAKITGRALSAVPADRLRIHLSKLGLRSLPGLPQLLDVPCLYEHSLQHPLLWLDSGEPKVLLGLAPKDFHGLLAGASVGDFGVPVAQIHPNLSYPEDDHAQLVKAVESFTTRRIRQRLEEVTEIPPLPQSANRIIRLRVDPNATVADVTNLVETDPALAAQVISWAASPYYASVSKIRSVEDAIARVLGFDIVINLALGLALGKAISLPKEETQQNNAYWQQAIYTAAVIDGLVRLLPQPQRPEVGLAYLCGLLHNFGYLVLAHVFPPHFVTVSQHCAANPHLPHTYVEQYLLGITREQIGAWLMQHWGMPQELQIAVRLQHDPDYQGPHAIYANLVYLTTHLLNARSQGNTSGCDILPALFERIGINRQAALKVIQNVFSAEDALRELAKQVGRTN